MIEVSAKLTRGAVYLTGETLECTICFTNPSLSSLKTSQSHDDFFESLAWASAQIQCQCATDSKLFKQSEDSNSKSISINDTALAAGTRGSGNIEIATKPRILFCDLRLSPGQTKTYIYRETVPNDAPPSYRGQLIKYSYKITIGTQRVNSPIKMLHIPLRVLPVSIGMCDISALCNDTSEELSPANPFQETGQTETALDVALQTLQTITARRTPNFYTIVNNRGKVGRFCLFKAAYKMGEDVIGTLDFRAATVTCIQVSVSLQCEEETSIEENRKQVRISTHSKHHEVCLGLKHTQLVLPIPLHVTPVFSTNLVSLKWRLHFEFVTSTSKGLEPPSLEDNEWKAPADVAIETMVWNLPIHLFSTTPHQVSQGVRTVQKLIIR